MAVIACAQCQGKVNSESPWCPDCGHDPRTGEPGPGAALTQPEWDVVGECTACGGELCTMGIEGFRMGGIHGAWGLAIGTWSDVTEHVMKVEILFCKECRRMEFRLPG